MRAQKWFNGEDFSKGLAIARARYSEPARQAVATKARDSHPSDDVPVEPLKSGAPVFVMRVRGWPAKFIRPWRVGLHQSITRI